LEDVGIFFWTLGPFYGLLLYFWPFGIVRGNLVYFSRFGILYQAKSGNPTLEKNSFRELDYLVTV
jgi:hypothetical protein